MPKTTAPLTHSDTPYITFFGKPTTKILERTYSDGRVVHACGECDFEGEFWQTVGAHRRKAHNTPSGKTLGRPKGTVKDPRERAIFLLNQAIDLLNEAQDDSWKKRALKAEGQIKTMRRLFKED